MLSAGPWDRTLRRGARPRQVTDVPQRPGKHGEEGSIALVSLKVNVAAFLAMIALGYLVFLAMGFAVSSWITDAQRAPTVATSIGMPMMFIAFFPSEALPQPVTLLVNVLPIGFMIDGVRHIGQGAGMTSVVIDLIGLSLWALALLLAAARIFRWEEARR
jgi:ABC-type multidrug transport system permease subunit